MAIRRIDRGRDALLAQLREKLVAKVGYPYENNPMHREARVKVAELAYIHEYGSLQRKIPSRPFMRATGRRERKKMAQLYRAMFTVMVHGGMTLRQLLGRMGIYYASEMKETIAHHGPGIFVPLRPATVARKGSSWPLLDTGGMKNAITSVVTRADEVRP